MSWRTSDQSKTETRLLQSLLPSGIASVCVHGLILFVTFLAARGCDQGIQAEAGGEKFQQIGLAQLPDRAADSADALSSAAELPEQPSDQQVSVPDATTAVPDQLPTEHLQTQPDAAEARDTQHEFNVIGPGTPLSRAVSEPIRVLPSAGSQAGGGSLTPGPGDTSFMEISDSGERFVYVIDTSGSMRDNGKFGLAQAQLKKSLSMLRPHQSFQIVFYGEAALELMLSNRPKGLLQATVPNLNMAKRRIDQEDPMGGTDHLPALKRAFQFKPDVVYFLTDGESASHKRSELDKVLRLNAAGARIHVIQFALSPPESRGPNWLQRLATDTGGKYRRIQL